MVLSRTPGRKLLPFTCSLGKAVASSADPQRDSPIHLDRRRPHLWQRRSLEIPAFSRQDDQKPPRMRLASALDQAEHVHDNANVVVSLYFGVQSLLLAWLSLEVHRGANRAATRSGSRKFPLTILLSPILTDWLRCSAFPSTVFFGYRRSRSIDYDDWT